VPKVDIVQDLEKRTKRVSQNIDMYSSLEKSEYQFGRVPTPAKPMTPPVKTDSNEGLVDAVADEKPAVPTPPASGLLARRRLMTVAPMSLKISTSQSLPDVLTKPKQPYLSYLATITKAPESDGLADLKPALAQLPDLPIHLCSLCDPMAVCLANKLYKRNRKITASTPMHHLYFNASQI
jgi:hypothetical protein